MFGNWAQDATKSNTRSEDALDALDANLTSLASGCKAEVSDTLYIFADECCWSYHRLCLDFYRLSGSYSPIPLPFPTLSWNIARFLRSTAGRVSIKVSCFRLISIRGSIRPEYPLAVASGAWTLSL